MDGAVDQVPVRSRAVRLEADEVVCGAVVGDGGQRHDQVAELVACLQAAARSDSQQLLDAELDELLEDDRRTGTAHAGSLHRDGLALEGAGIAEEPALRVPLHDVVEVGLGDVCRSQRIAREQTGLGVVARVGADVDRHGRRA